MEHVARVKEKGNPYRTSLGKSAVKRPLERNRLRFKDKVEICLKGMRMGCTFLVLGGLFEHCNEHPVPIHFSEFLNSLRNY